MKQFLAMCLGLLLTLYGINQWAGTLAPHIERTERIVLDDTFYEQNVQLDSIIHSLRQEQQPKIIALGDSTMYGSIVYQNETIPYYLRGFIQNRLPNADVVNLAYPGARPADLYAMLKLADQANPSLVVIDVNVVFFSERILAEGALANKNHRRAFLFENADAVPAGVFQANRLEEIAKTYISNTNIGQYQSAINNLLFGSSPRSKVRNAAAKLQPPPAQQQAAGTVAPAESIIGRSWHDKTWDDKERQNMARIYEQGPLTEANDSVKMLRQIIKYSKDRHIPTLFYLAPQNEALISKFFSLDQLHHNEDFLKNILDEQNAWYLDLRNAIPENQFGDYDHMLKSGNSAVAKWLDQAIAQEGSVLKK